MLPFSEAEKEDEQQFSTEIWGFIETVRLKLGGKKKFTRVMQISVSLEVNEDPVI